MISLLERLASIEHDQWIAWSKEIAKTEPISSVRRNRWEKLWIPYKQLSEDDKKHDRKWAKKVIDELEGENLE